MVKKLLCVCMTAVMFASMLCIGASADFGKAGDYYYTDIKTYVRGQLIDSYNVGGKTVIVAEDLNSYGFIVSWTESNRTLRITDNNGKAVTNAKNNISGAIGDVAGNYYHTDIVTYFKDVPIESYNLGGYTVFPATLLRDFGYDVIWDSENRRVLIDTDASTFVAGSADITNVTEKPNQTYHGTVARITQAPNFNGMNMITSNNCYLETSLDKKTYVPFRAFADCLGISYGWDSATSTITVSVPDDKVIAPLQSQLKPSYKLYGAVEYEIKDIYLNFVNGTETHKDIDAVVYGTEVFVEVKDLATALNFFCVNQVDFYTETMMFLLYSGIY